MCRASLISLDGEAYLLPNFDNDSKRKHISDENIYILALDGDTDFHPSALILLVDRLRMYGNVGAACGRIHPTGMGKNFVFSAKRFSFHLKVFLLQVLIKDHI